ncbi:MAG: alanine:cation symporter family protein [Blautia sp.]
MFALFENLTNWLWGLPLLITILVTGIYLTIRSGFFQFRHFGHIIKNMFSKERREEGGDDGKSLTPFQAISIAIGGTVGVSNMSGVATAIATGGPGALFWLWVAALPCHGHQNDRGNSGCLLQRKTAKWRISRWTDLLYAERSGR